MEIKKLELLNNFMDEVKEFTKRILKDLVQDLDKNGVCLNKYFINMYIDTNNVEFFCRIYDRKPTNIYNLKEYSTNLIDFIDNQNEHIDKYKDLIINSLKKDKLIMKSDLCFYLSDVENNENLLKFHEKRMHYLRLCSDLDYGSTRFNGTLDSFKKLYSLFSDNSELGEEKFKGGKSERNKFFAEYYTLIKNVIGMDYEVKKINDLHYFFIEVGNNLTQKQIEAPFIKIIENKTMDEDFMLLKNVNNIICDLIGENNVKSKELKKLQIECKDNLEPKFFNTLAIESFKAITFSDNYFSEYSFKYCNPDCFRKLPTEHIESFHNLLMYLLTNKNAQEIYGVVKSSSFQLPTSEKGFLMQVNENYNENKLHKGIGLICEFIQNKTLINPLDYESNFQNYQTNKILNTLDPYLLEIKIKEVLDVQQEVNICFEEIYKI